MPRGDGTGPQGKGPRTGRGLGKCGGKEKPTFGTPPGRGRGLGPGLGRGMGRIIGRNREPEQGEDK